MGGWGWVRVWAWERRGVSLQVVVALGRGGKRQVVSLVVGGGEGKVGNVGRSFVVLSEGRLIEIIGTERGKEVPAGVGFEGFALRDGRKYLAVGVDVVLVLFVKVK